MKFKAENIEACEPINQLLTKLIEKNFTITTSKVGDVHFNELHFLLSSQTDEQFPDNILIESIKKKSASMFCCTCHWSIVELKN